MVAISSHARVRGKQRGISEAEMTLIASFGRTRRCAGNAMHYYLDREGYLQLEEVLRKGVQILDKLKNQIVICGDDQTIITCYHRSSNRRSTKQGRNSDAQHYTDENGEVLRC
jgi:hypothetical protein